MGKETSAIDLFAETAAILISIVLKDIMGCLGGKLRRNPPEVRVTSGQKMAVFMLETLKSSRRI